jgi:hypothetical protein
MFNKPSLIGRFTCPQSQRLLQGSQWAQGPWLELQEKRPQHRRQMQESKSLPAQRKNPSKNNHENKAEVKHHHRIGKETIHTPSKREVLAWVFDQLLSREPRQGVHLCTVLAQGGYNQITYNSEMQWSGELMVVSCYLPRTPNKLLRDIVVSRSRSAITRAKL